MRGVINYLPVIVGGSLGAKIFVFYVCVCVWVFGGDKRSAN